MLYSNTREHFDPKVASSRNIGWVTEPEQASLRGRRVAIAGIGGVGGAYVFSFTNLGIDEFSIADPDTFEVQNFNRQKGANMLSVGELKTGVIAMMAKNINPQISIRAFPEGVTPENIDDFLEGSSVYVDGIDFFEPGVRRMIANACYVKGIPFVTAAPLGMSCSLIVFMPGGMTYDEYFGPWDSGDSYEAYVTNLSRFLVGVAPKFLHKNQLVDRSKFSVSERKAPSIIVGPDLCAGVAVSTVIKILLRRGRVPVAPRSMQFDAYRNKLVHVWRPWGWRNPLQRIAFRVVKGMLMCS